MYPEIFGAAKLYRGPLGDEFGFDEAWRYDSVLEALEAAREWDGESSEPPSGAYQRIGAEPHQGQSRWHRRCHANGCEKQLHGGKHCASGECAIRLTGER